MDLPTITEVAHNSSDNSNIVYMEDGIELHYGEDVVVIATQEGDTPLLICVGETDQLDVNQLNPVYGKYVSAWLENGAEASTRDMTAEEITHSQEVRGPIPVE